MIGDVISISGDVIVIRAQDVDVDVGTKVDVKKHREKRSLSANGYAWALIDKLAVKLKIPKEQIYKDAIKNIGGNNTTVCVQNCAVKSLCEGWSNNGLGWLTETAESKIEGCTNVTLYYGSSTYDTEQMSRLIYLIQTEAREQNIETRTPDEIQKLLDLWGAKNDRSK